MIATHQQELLLPLLWESHTPFPALKLEKCILNIKLESSGIKLIPCL